MELRRSIAGVGRSLWGARERALDFERHFTIVETSDQGDAAVDRVIQFTEETERGLVQKEDWM